MIEIKNLHLVITDYWKLIKDTHRVATSENDSDWEDFGEMALKFTDDNEDKVDRQFLIDLRNAYWDLLEREYIKHENNKTERSQAGS